ncbi:MAG: hypothetical protein M3306_13210 [Actinomycetota bacterium]|nr:hypothetical protein [Actinomycetota bacterium]
MDSLRTVQNAIGNAEEALFRAGLVLTELDTVAESSVGVLNEASVEALRARDEKDPVHRAQRLHDVTDAHLLRLHTRADFIANGSRDLIEHLDRATVAADYASRMLETMTPVEGHREAIARLQSHVARIGAVLTHAVPLAEQLAHHGDAILKLTDVSNAPTDQRLLEEHQRLGRAVENVDLLRSLVVGAHATSKTALGLTGDLTYGLARPPDLGRNDPGLMGGRHAAPRR